MIDLPGVFVDRKATYMAKYVIRRIIFAQNDKSSLRNIIKDEVKRGKVDVYINLENNEQGVANINTELAKKIGHPAPFSVELPYR